MINDIWTWASNNPLFSIPVGLFILWYLYNVIFLFLIPEFLDLILNSWKINQLLKHSDSIDLKSIETEFQIARERQSNLNQSNLKILEFSMRSNNGKYILDIFKVN